MTAEIKLSYSKTLAYFLMQENKQQRSARVMRVCVRVCMYVKT